MYRERNLSLLAVAPDLSIRFDRHDFLELLGNLTDNAAKWARKCVSVTLSVSDARLTLVVEDDGKGCDSMTMIALTSRGARLDEEQRGHGLGLSIVKELVEGYRGTVDFSVSPQFGGLMVTVVMTLD